MRKNNQPIVSRGEIYYAELSPVVGSEQGGLRPVLIIQNDVGNRNAPTTIVAPITSKLGKTTLPTHINLKTNEGGLKTESIVLLEQIRVIDKQRLRCKMGQLGLDKMESIDNGIKVSLGL